jgi:hypothetical protein
MLSNRNSVTPDFHASPFDGIFVLEGRQQQNSIGTGKMESKSL